MDERAWPAEGRSLVSVTRTSSTTHPHQHAPYAAGVLVLNSASPHDTGTVWALRACARARATHQGAPLRALPFTNPFHSNATRILQFCPVPAPDDLSLHCHHLLSAVLWICHFGACNITGRLRTLATYARLPLLISTAPHNHSKLLGRLWLHHPFELFCRTRALPSRSPNLSVLRCRFARPWLPAIGVLLHPNILYIYLQQYAGLTPTLHHCMISFRDVKQRCVLRDTRDLPLDKLACSIEPTYLPSRRSGRLSTLLKLAGADRIGQQRCRRRTAASVDAKTIKEHCNTFTFVHEYYRRIYCRNSSGQL